MKDLGVVIGALAVLTVAACNSQPISKCQAFSSEIVETSATVMHHPLSHRGFDSTLNRVEKQVFGLSGLPELDEAKRDYRKKMVVAKAFAVEANSATSPVAIISANASARAEAAKAIYHLMESTNLHCAGER